MVSTLEMSFEEAMEAAALWCGAWEQGDLSDEVLADKVADLVASRDGARGFFVVSLPAENPLMDRLPEPLVMALRSAGEGCGFNRSQLSHEHCHGRLSPKGGR